MKFFKDRDTEIGLGKEAVDSLSLKVFKSLRQSSFIGVLGV